MTSVYSFKREEFERAVKQWRLAEHSGINAVLVTVDSMHDLMLAYPNYFADTEVFLGVLDESLAGNVPDRRRG
jgi:hypothetical protein